MLLLISRVHGELLQKPAHRDALPLVHSPLPHAHAPPRTHAQTRRRTEAAAARTGDAVLDMSSSAASGNTAAMRDCCGESSSSACSSSACEHANRLGSAATAADAPLLRFAWPVPLFTPFSTVKTPFDEPGDFRGRPLAFVLENAQAQLVSMAASGAAAREFQGPSNEGANVLHGALTELERLSFKKPAVQQLLQLGAVPVLADALRGARQDTACKAAVVLWNCAFQKPACIADIKATVRSLVLGGVSGSMAAVCGAGGRGGRRARSFVCHPLPGLMPRRRPRPFPPHHPHTHRTRSSPCLAWCRPTRRAHATRPAVA